jgi:hypothetical protein
VASIAGKSADAVETLFQSWRHLAAEPDADAVDHFCEQLRINGTALPIVHFCEWVDRWLMCDLVPGPNHLEGSRYHVTCMSPTQAADWADQCGTQFLEQLWLSARLREAAVSWELVADRRVIVVIREVIGGSTLDDDIRNSLACIPSWLSGK